MKSVTSKIAWNTIIQFIGKGASAGVGLLITMILTRYLGPAGYGDYTFIIVFVTMFGAIADWGFYLVGVSETSKHAEAEQGKVIGNVLIIRLVLAGVAMVVANATIFLVPQLLPHANLQGLVLVGSAFIFIFSLKTSLQLIFNARLRMEFWAISELVANLSGILLVVTLVFYKAPLVDFIWVLSIGQIFSLVAAYVLARRLVKVDLTMQKQLMTKIVKEALPVGALLVVFTVYSRIDILILGHFKGPEAVGFYGAAYKVYDVLVLGAAYFANSTLPILAEVANKDMVRFKRVFLKSTVVLGTLGILVAVANFIFAPLAIQIIGGSEYQPATLALQILSLALFVSYFNHLNGYSIIALSKQWYSFLIAVLALGLNIIINVLLIPYYSLYAAAFNTFLTEGFIMLLSLFILQSKGNVKFSLREVFASGESLFDERDRFVRYFKERIKSNGN